jgi:hypothetical protein
MAGGTGQLFVVVLYGSLLTRVSNPMANIDQNFAS